MSIASDFKTLYHLTLAPVRGDTHAERLENFYQGQAGNYDAFRVRLLQGREAMWQSIPVPENGTWVDMGGGTGANLDYLGERIHRLSKIYVVDLSWSLLAVARQRIAAQHWSHVEAVEADATTFQPQQLADVVTFSYSLTMIPNWFDALDNAMRMLRPGGTIGIVDFFVSRKHAESNAGRARHSWFTRTFWPTWFAVDNVYLNPDHVPYLHQHFDRQQYSEHLARVPFLPLLRVPYYTFVGRRPTTAGALINRTPITSHTIGG